jgi:hypothetical protein
MPTASQHVIEFSHFLVSPQLAQQALPLGAKDNSRNCPADTCSAEGRTNFLDRPERQETAMNKDRTAAIPAPGERAKTNSAEYLWICRGIIPPASSASWSHLPVLRRKS